MTPLRLHYTGMSSSDRAARYGRSVDARGYPTMWVVAAVDMVLAGVLMLGGNALLNSSGRR